MATLTIVPNESVNGIKFGTSQVEVETTFGKPASLFKKTRWSKGTTADYGDFHLLYDSNGELEAIEIFNAKVELPDIRLVVPSSVDEVLEAIPSLKKDEYGFTSKSESVGTYSEGETIEAILFGKSDYYE